MSQDSSKIYQDKLNYLLTENNKIVTKTYEKTKSVLDSYKKAFSKPLNLSNKILIAHLDQYAKKDPDYTKSLFELDFCYLHPDRLAMQDATAQMALLQFLQSKQSEVKIPSSVHCDHLILAYKGAAADLYNSKNDNSEVFEFLQSVSEKYGLGFWAPGSGIIHQIVLENYAFPGGLMIGTDSHTPNAGGLGMVAVGVGGADAVDTMVGMPWELARPKIVAVNLKAKLSGWSAPKDIILKVLEKLTVKGGKDVIFEYIGEGAQSLSCTGKATITNMGAELGATTSVFSYDDKIKDYLNATGRSSVADLCQEYKEYLLPDPEVLADPAKYYDDVLEIDLNELKPIIVGPHSPDLARNVSAMADDVKKNNYPDNISAALIGSCTNSSYEDMYKASKLALYLTEHNIKSAVPFFITPGSSTVYDTVENEDMLKNLENFGGTILANACGPCIGQWKRDDVKMGEPNSIVTSFNRNFRGRNDANKATLGFITSPEMVVAYAASGSLSFNPQKDALTAEDGSKVYLKAPEAKELPEDGLKLNLDGFYPPKAIKAQAQVHSLDTATSIVQINSQSQRLQLLEPFKPWDGKDFISHQLLIKVKGKCTTDHISPAGRWLRYRGHLQLISDNLLSGASSYYDQEIGHTKNALLEGNSLDKCSVVAKYYKSKSMPWVIVGEDNYGEGSSREHAAMSPRFLGASCVIVKSYARIHATNLKKQGILALSFVDSKDFDKVQEFDKISVLDLKNSFKPNQNLEVVLDHLDGSKDKILVSHSFNLEQINWFKYGSALNALLNS